jgi:hypothetical protein
VGLTRPAGEVLSALAAAVRAEGGLLAGVLRAGGPDPARPPVHGPLAARGPRGAGREAELAFVVEAVREGYLLHHGPGGRVLDPEDADLALLGGDRLYAIGLERLADAGDLHSVAELADVIALGARAHAEDDPGLADAAWAAGAAAVGWGPDPALAEAKAAAHAGAPGAAAALMAAARQLAGTWRAEAHSPQGTLKARSTLSQR